MPLNIEKIRKLMGDKSQAEVAASAGMMREAFARILAGKKKQVWLSTVERIAGALGCEAEDLLQ